MVILKMVLEWCGVTVVMVDDNMGDGGEGG